MTLKSLHKTIAEANWFSRVGSAGHGEISLSSVSQLSDWEWLPTSREQDDPIHESSRLTHATEQELQTVKLVLNSIRGLPDRIEMLVDGPHNYTNAAIGGLQYAARLAAREIANNAPGFWCRCIELYASGWWPMGLTDDGRVVVY